jgi:hypothetical protein
MKKSLSLISLTLIILAFCSCHNIKTSGQEKNSDLNLVRTDSIHKADSVSAINQTPTSGLVGTDKGIKKDSSEFKGKGNAIIHHAPNQDKIDSIKNAKTKTK